jgi:hypothetical protein
MALYNQNDLQSSESQFKNWPIPRRWLTENGQIPEDNLLRMAKFKIWLTEFGQIPSLRQAWIYKEDLMKQAA